MAEGQTRKNRQLTVGLIGVLLASNGLGTAAFPEVVSILTQLTPPVQPDEAEWLASLTAGGNLVGDLGVPAGPAQEIEGEAAAAWLALYLVAAAGRLAEAYFAFEAGLLETAKLAEERYFELHLFAESRRQRAAALQDMAAKLNEDRPTPLLLGWRAVLDERTTPECRWAHGRNFKADEMPVIGWPGAVHMHCRCSPGPSIPGAALIPSV